MTAQTLIDSALRLLSNHNPTTSDRDNGLEALNSLITNWSAERIQVPIVIRENFTLTVGQDTYTTGSGGDFNTVRPMRIVDAFIRDSEDNDYLLEIITRDRYINIDNKTTDGRPGKLYYVQEYPLGKIYFDSQPAVAEDIYLYSQKTTTEIAALTTVISLPDEFKRALKTNLALDLAPEYGVAVPPWLATIANKSKGVLETQVILESMRVVELPNELNYSLLRGGS